jgi:riboflavin kinase/FMN adenylyltransferase
MRVAGWDELKSARAGAPIAAAIGVFDGLHIGHRELIRRVLGRGGLASAVVTFKENPKRILSPATFHGELSTLEQRLGLIESMGVDLCVLIDFSGDFSKLPGRRFLSLLRESGDLRFLAVGSGFRCGHRLDTDAEGIREFCAEGSIGVEFLEAVQWAGHPVSSSRIRKAILDGRLEDAERMLGRPYEIDLRGANLSPAGRRIPMGGQASPPAGSYEALVAFAEGLSVDSDRRVVALDADGSWSIPLEGEPVGLRLVRMLSRE